MPETTPLIKAALNLRVGAGFDVYLSSFTVQQPETNIIVFFVKKSRVHISFPHYLTQDQPLLVQIVYLFIQFFYRFRLLLAFHHLTQFSQQRFQYYYQALSSKLILCFSSNLKEVSA